MRTVKTTADAPTKRAKVLRLPQQRASRAEPPRPVTAKTAPTAANPERRMHRKYARLYRKYIDVVQETWTTSGRRLAALQQGWWALESTQAALALVRGKKLTVCNARFRQLNRTSAR